MPAIAGYLGFPDAYIHWYKSEEEAASDSHDGDVLVKLENGFWGINRRGY